MNYIHLKNYRSLKDAEFVLGNENYFVGDNNTGKSSLLKLIESLFQNTKLNFEKTSLENIILSDLSHSEEDKTIKVFYSFNSDNPKSLNKNDFASFFEFFEISTINNYEYPLITKIITPEPNKEFLCEFNINYELFKSEVKIKEIKISKFKNNFFKDKVICKEDDRMIDALLNSIKKEQSIDLFNKKLDYEKIYEDFFDLFKNNQKKIEFNIKKILFFLTNFQRSKLEIEILYDLYFWVNELYFFNTKKDNQDNKTKVSGTHVVSRAFNDFPIRTKYINPLRPIFKEYYNKEEVNHSAVTPLFERKKESNLVIEKINNFLKNANMLESIKLDSIKLKNESTLYFPIYNKSYKKNMKLSISGTGVSQVLPILFEIFEDTNDKIFIEQPEVHLHPRAQSLLGEIFANYYLDIKKMKKNENIFTKQLFIETHSMYILDRFRNIFSKKFKQEKQILASNLKISIFYLENNVNTVVLKTLFIKSNGKYNGDVDNFLNYFITDAIESFQI